MKKRILKENSQSWPTAADIEKFIKNYPYNLGFDPSKDSHKSTHYQYRDWDNFSDVEKAIINSVAVFTGGHVASVRDVSKFDKDLAYKPNELIPIHGEFRNPDLSDYKLAHHVMSLFASRPCDPIEVYRGIGVERDPSFFKGLKPGIEFNNWPISSFATKESTARGFAKMAATMRRAKEPMVITVQNMNKGSLISPYSLYADEYEFVSSARLMIIHYESLPLGGKDWHYLTCEAF